MRVTPLISNLLVNPARILTTVSDESDDVDSNKKLDIKELTEISKTYINLP